MKKTKAFYLLLALVAMVGCKNNNLSSSEEEHSNSNVETSSSDESSSTKEESSSSSENSSSSEEQSSSNNDESSSSEDSSSSDETSSSEEISSEIVDELKEDKENAINEIDAYISETTIYSAANNELITSNKDKAKGLINDAITKEKIIEVVDDYKAFADNLLTIKGEKAKEFMDGITYVSTNSDKHYSFDKKSGVITQSTELQFYGEVKMGTQNNNNFVAFDTYITFNYMNTQYSSATILFRQWDTSTTYSISITNDKMSLVKKSWGNEDKVIQTSKGIENKNKVHLQILCSGWQKSVLVDGENVLEICESDFTVGNTSLISWETAITLEDAYYHEYATVEEFNEVYGDLIYTPNINTKRQEAIKAINDYVDSLSGINEASLNTLKDLASTYINDVSSVTTIDEVNSKKEEALATLKEKYEKFKNEEEEVIKAEIEARRQANESFLNNKVTEKPNTITINELGQIVQSDTANGTNLIVGTNNDGSYMAFEMDITANYPNTTYSAMALYFREWDTSNNYYLSIQDGEVVIKKATWGAETEVLYKTAGIKNNTKTNIKIICSGWEKYVFLNDSLVYKINEGSYTVGRIRLNTWQTSYIIDKANYIVYENNDQLLIDYKDLFDKINKEEQEKIEAKRQANETFLNSMTDKDGTFTINELGQIYKDDSQSSGQAIIGTQNDGDVVAFEMDIKLTYRNETWSSFTLHFREWDNSNNYYLSIQDAKVVVKKAVWNQDSQTLFTSESGFKNNEMVNIKILCAGWDKAIYINNNLLYKISESSYTCGRIRLESWETAYAIDTIKYTKYEKTADLLSDYPIANGTL